MPRATRFPNNRTKSLLRRRQRPKRPHRIFAGKFDSFGICLKFQTAFITTATKRKNMKRMTVSLSCERFVKPSCRGVQEPKLRRLLGIGTVISGAQLALCSGAAALDHANPSCAKKIPWFTG